MRNPFVDMAWRKALGILDRSDEGRTLKTREGRLRSLAGRVVDLCRQEIQHQRSSIDPESITPGIKLGRPVVFIDIETTGFEPWRSITEIGLVRTDQHLREVAFDHVRVVPDDLSADKWIRENTSWGLDAGCDVDRWVELGALSVRDALLRISPLLEGAAPAGHNLIAFDSGFIQRAYKNHLNCATGRWVQSSDWLYRSIDTKQMSVPLFARGQVKSSSLSKLCERFGIEMERHHCALSDARASLALARILLEEV